MNVNWKKSNPRVMLPEGCPTRLSTMQYKTNVTPTKREHMTTEAKLK
jgi:hypothetical protein